MMLMHPNNSMDCNRRTPFYSSSILLEAEDNSANGIAALIASSCTPTATTASPSHGFQGSRIFEGGGNERKRAAPTSSSYPMLDMSDHEMGDEEGSDDCVQLGEKKRRLTFEQVKALEKNFEVANKLEPEKKMQLAKALGLQPRQIAVWFQNRRARWKTKQLEKDFTVLKDEYDSLKHNYDKLIEENGNLQAMVERLSSKLQSCHEQHNSKLGDTSNTNSNSSKVHNEDGDAERPYLMVNSLSSNFVCKDSQDNANEGPASETSSVLNMDSPGTATIDSHYTTDSAHLCEEAPPQHNPEFIRPKVEDNEPSQSDEPCNLFYSNLEHGGLWWEYWPQGI